MCKLPMAIGSRPDESYWAATLLPVEQWEGATLHCFTMGGGNQHLPAGAIDLMPGHVRPPPLKNT